MGQKNGFDTKLFYRPYGNYTGHIFKPDRQGGRRNGHNL